MLSDAGLQERSATLSKQTSGGLATHRISVDECRKNFSDLAHALGPNEARIASERCLFCYDAPCITACPTSIEIPLFIRQIDKGSAVDAAKNIIDANHIGSRYSRVCPT